MKIERTKLAGSHMTVKFLRMMAPCVLVLLGISAFGSSMSVLISSDYSAQKTVSGSHNGNDTHTYSIAVPSGKRAKISLRWITASMPRNCDYVFLFRASPRESAWGYFQGSEMGTTREWIVSGDTVFYVTLNSTPRQHTVTDYAINPLTGQMYIAGSHYETWSSWSCDSTYAITVTYEDLVPDLTVSSVSVDPSDSVMKWDEATLNFLVKNTGEKSAAMTKAQIFDGATKLGEVSIDALSPGASSKKSFTLPTLSVGEHWLMIFIVAVSDEKLTSNNSMSISLMVCDANAYTVKFNANGGTNVMVPQMYEAGRVYKLPKCVFVKPEGKTRFVGWEGSNGRRYDDEMMIFNLAPIGDSVTLKAIWDPTAEEKGAVQLWENGPYWAECNVGATKPEECGYYFWWGDTVGYRHNVTNDEWISVKDGTKFLFSEDHCPTYRKSISELRSLGYVDSAGNLVAAHDAATAHLGASWRMPTDAEFGALIKNCTTSWTTRNGVIGRLVTGKGTYASKSIFFPAAGYGHLFYLANIIDPRGIYLSSTPHSDLSDYAWNLSFNSGYFISGIDCRYYGQSVRPVRGYAK